MAVPLDEQHGVLFSTLWRHLITIRGELWRTVMQLVGTQEAHQHEIIASVATRDELQLLEDLHFLTQLNQDQILFARYLINLAKYNTSVMSLFISFTSRCNFKCSYCYQDFRMSHSAEDLSLQKWRTLFTFIQSRALESRISDLSVALFGGEPLLNLKIVGRACEDLKTLQKEGCRVSLALITNGALLTPSVWKSLAPYVDMVQITLDGIKEVHDKHRPFVDGRGSYEVIMANSAALGREAYNSVNV